MSECVTANSGTTWQFCSGLFRKTSVEFRLLAACCIWPPQTGESKVRGLLETQEVDWEALLALGERHRVSGFLAGALKLQPVVPHVIRQKLKSRAERIERENLLQLAVAIKVSQAIQNAGLPFVMMKGTALAKPLYGSITVRHSKDVDLLVTKGDVPEIGEILRLLGFQQAAGLGENLTLRQARSWEQHRKHHDFTHTATGVQLELHWRAFDNPHLGVVSLQDREWIECSPGMSLPGLSRHETFLLLCAHGAGHAWFRMKWLVDIAAMLAESDPEEQAGLVRLAEERGLGRPAEQALLLCASLFEDDRIVIPQKSTAIGRWLAKVGRDALQQETLAKSPDAEFVPRRLWLSRLLLRPGWVYRWREVKIYATSPADWKAVGLPDWLHFAYPIVRVPLWLWRRWSPSKRP